MADDCGGRRDTACLPVQQVACACHSIWPAGAYGSPCRPIMVDALGYQIRKRCLADARYRVGTAPIDLHGPIGFRHGAR